MQHMLCVTTGLDTLPLLYAVTAQPLLWNTDTIRTAHPGSVHKDVSDILLHFQAPAEFEAMRDGHECVPRPAYWALPEAQTAHFWPDEPGRCYTFGQGDDYQAAARRRDIAPHGFRVADLILLAASCDPVRPARMCLHRRR